MSNPATSLPAAPAGPPARVAPRYILTRWLFLRLLGVVYFSAFASLWPQIPGLIGKNGLLPAADFLAATGIAPGPQQFWLLPTLAWLNPSDGFLLLLCGGGVLLSLLLIAGILPGPVLLLLWVCYLSLVNIGQDFLSFQWDILLLEAGFLAIFLAPGQIWPRSARETPPSRLVLLLLRLLLFRLMFSSGVVKLASGDPTWHNLTALSYHYETQPLPTPLAWYMYQLPLWFHTVSTGFVFVAELAAPFLIFAPRRARFAGAGLLAGLQLLILLTGNFAFFNLLTLALCVLLLDDAVLRRYLPARVRAQLPDAPPPPAAPRYRRLATVPLAAVILLLGAMQLAGILLPELSLPAPALEVAGLAEPFHLVNSYGLFAVMTTTRPEIIIEGSMDGTTWREYGFFAKVGDLRRAPPWVAPHQPRLDWQLWFAALDSPASPPWFARLMQGLLHGSPEILGLLETDPFPQAPPRYVRALLYNYRFTDVPTRVVSGTWWRRELQGLYFPAISLSGQ